MTVLAPVIPIRKDEVFYHGYDIVVSRGPLRVSAEEKEPETARAILMCESCEEPTRHNFKGRRLLSAKKNPLLACDEFVYMCCTCGAERVWGMEDVSSSKKK